MVCLPDDADGETDCDELSLEARSLSDKMRFEAGSASVWRLLQRHIQPRGAQLLKPLVFQAHMRGQYNEDDELLFTTSQESQCGDNHLFDDGEYDLWYDEEDLFDIIDDYDMDQEENDFESDDDLFRDEVTEVEVNRFIRYSQNDEVRRVRDDPFDHGILEELEFLPKEEDVFAEEDLFRYEIVSELVEDDMLL